jgi:putative ABC transport system permease protein
VAIVVAVLGITNTLGTLMIERRGEISILKFLGASPRQLKRMTLTEAFLTGLLGLTLGCLLGFGLALILIFVINRQAFGWTIQFDPPWLSVILALAGVLVATLLSGLYPARLVTRTDPIRSLRAE